MTATSDYDLGMLTLCAHGVWKHARWSDRVVVLSKGVVVADGPPAEAITPAVLASVYRVAARVETQADGLLHISIDDILARANLS